MDAAGCVAYALGDGAGDAASLNLNVLRKNIYGHIQQCAPAGLFSSTEFHIALHGHHHLGSNPCMRHEHLEPCCYPALSVANLLSVANDIMLNFMLLMLNFGLAQATTSKSAFGGPTTNEV